MKSFDLSNDGKGNRKKCKAVQTHAAYDCKDFLETISLEKPHGFDTF
jgi:hypothetical protein